MYCPSCGTQLKLQARFCEHCGADASSAALRRPIRADYETKMSEPARCAGCGGDLHPGDRFCERCGKQVERVQLRRPKCVVCGTPLEDDAVFCVSCGMEYRPDAEGPLERTGADGKPERLRPCCPECHTPLTELSDHCTGCGLDLKHLRRRTVRLVDENGKLTCPVCGTAGQPANRRVCWSCGASFEKAEQGGAVFCKFCGRSYSAQLGACPHCKTPAPGVAGFRAPAPEPEPPKSPEELAREREAEDRVSAADRYSEQERLARERNIEVQRKLQQWERENAQLGSIAKIVGCLLAFSFLTSICCLMPLAKIAYGKEETLGLFDADGFLKFMAIFAMIGGPVFTLSFLCSGRAKNFGMLYGCAACEVLKSVCVLLLPDELEKQVRKLVKIELSDTGVILVILGFAVALIALGAADMARKKANAAEQERLNIERWAINRK